LTVAENKQKKVCSGNNLQKTKTTCSGKKLQGKKRKQLALEIICRKPKKTTCYGNLQKTENLALEFFCRKKNSLALEICRKQKTWSECLQKTGNLVSKLAFMI
jgi:ABC-type uncharacterized transport system ATPase subunit